MTAEDPPGDVIVINGFYTNAGSLGIKIIGKGLGSDESLLFPGVDAKNDGVTEGVFAQDPGQFHDQCSTCRIITDTKGVPGDIAVTFVTAVDMAFHDDQ